MVLHLETRRLLDRATRWFLQTRGGVIDVQAEVERFASVVEDHTSAVPSNLLGTERERFDRLMRRFEQQTGQTIGRWRQQARLFEALDLLARGESVTSAALSVGYASVSAFIERFRGTFGITPSRLMPPQR